MAKVGYMASVGICASGHQKPLTCFECLKRIPLLASAMEPESGSNESLFLDSVCSAHLVLEPGES